MRDHAGHTPGMPEKPDAVQPSAPAKSDAATPGARAKPDPHAGHDMGKSEKPENPAEEPRGEMSTTGGVFDAALHRG